MLMICFNYSSDAKLLLPQCVALETMDHVWRSPKKGRSEIALLAKEMLCVNKPAAALHQ
jgi:hypothetical protein